MKLDEIATVTRNIEQGAWVADLPNLPGVSVKVRGAYNADYSRLLAKLRSEMSPEEIRDPNIQDSLEPQLLHETVLLDWDGIEDTPYSKETAARLLTHPDYAAFRRAVSYAANVVARQGKASLEAARKN